MENSLLVLGAAFVVMLVSLSGVIFAGRLAQRFVEHRLPYLISFSAGVFLVTAAMLSFEVFEVFESIWGGILLIVLGYVLAWGVQALLPETHHHHDASCVTGKKGARRLIIGDSIHNIADGIVLVATFSVSTVVGLAVAASIIIHETLQEVAEYFVLRNAGYTMKRALLINFSVSSTILIGVFLGYFALASHTLEVAFLAISAGFFAHVVIHDLLPKPQEHETKKVFASHLALVLLGVCLMALINVALGESHSHDDDTHDVQVEHQ